MNIMFLDKHGDPKVIEGFDCMSDDDEWVTMIFGPERKAIHKCDIFDRTYVIYEESFCCEQKASGKR
jgi:hypothetical protein